MLHTDKERLAAIVAKLYADEFTLDDIIGHIENTDGKKITKGYVSKLKKYAEQRNWLKIEENRFYFKNNVPEEIRPIESTIPLEQKLLKKYSHTNIKKVIVHDFIIDKYNFDAALVRKVRNAMDFNISTVGVSCGRTLDYLIRSSEELGNVIPTNPNLVAFPMTAEFFGDDSNEYNATALAMEIAEIFSNNDQRKKVPSLASLPSCMPLKKSTAENTRILREGHIGYNTIFSGANSLANNMDTALCSVSINDKPFCGKHEKASSTMKDAGLSFGLERFIGDIAGVLLLKDPEDDSIIPALEAVISNITFDHLFSLATDAYDNEGKNGVIAIAANTGNEDKSDTLHVAIKRGLVNIVVCNSKLARKLLKKPNQSS